MSHPFRTRHTPEAAFCALFLAFLALNPALVTAAPATSIVSAKTAPSPKNSPQGTGFRGVVRGPNGQPIANALVVLQRPAVSRKRVSPITMRTDAKGQFSAQVVLEAPSKAEVLKAGGNQTSLLTAIIWAKGFAITQARFAPGEKTVSLKPGVSATGIVTDAKGKGIAGARVCVTDIRLATSQNEDEDFRAGSISLYDNSIASALDAAIATRSGPDGTWTLRDMPPGSTLFMGLSDPAFARQTLNAPLGTKPNVPTTLSPLIAKPGASIVGKVVFPDGKPLVGASVSSFGDQNYIESRTGADGTFKLSSLKTGKVALQIGPPSSTWAPLGVASLVVKAGEETNVKTLTLSSGIVLRGIVRNVVTNAPVAGALITASGPVGESLSTPSDANGRYTIHVAPGNNRYYLSSAPPNLFTNWEQFGDREPRQMVTVATKTAPDFELRPGVMVAGVAKDEDGRPAVGAKISLDTFFNIGGATVDTNGQWTIGNVNPSSRLPGGPSVPTGSVALKALGDWQIVGNAVVRPGVAPIALTLRRITRQNIKIRVVSPDGQPIPDANLSISISLGERSHRNQNGLTNENGEYELQGIRPEQEITFTPYKTGYTLVTRGTVRRLDPLNANDRKTPRTKEAVLALLNAKIVGRVVDAKGTPLSGVQVAPLASSDLRRDGIDTTDTTGQFAFDKLLAGKIAVGAARGRQWGWVETNASAIPGIETKITLGAPAPVFPGRDLDTTIALLTTWRAKGGIPSYGWGSMIGRIALIAPERALQLLKTEQTRIAKANEAAPENKREEQAYQALFRDVMEVLIARDPTLAAQWAETELANIPSQDGHAFTWLSIAANIIETDPTRARKIYERFAATISPDGTDLSDTYRYAQLAGLAGGLNLTEAAKWSDALDANIALLSKDEQFFRVGSFMESVAQADLPGAEKMMARLSPALQVRSLEEVIPIIAKRDLPTAQRLLAQMDALVARPDLPIPEDRNDAMYRPTPSHSLNVARQAVIKRLLATNPEVALGQIEKLTEDNYFRPDYRLEIAMGLPAAKAIPLLRDAFAGKGDAPDSFGEAGRMARIAALAATLDAKEGERMFGEARAKLTPNTTGPLADDDFNEMAMEYAFYRGPSNPAESRLLLENEWRRITERLRRDRENAKGKEGDMEFNYIQNLQNIAWAMTPVSVERADEMMREAIVLNPQGYNSDEPRRKLVAWLLATETERAKFAFLPMGEN